MNLTKTTIMNTILFVILYISLIVGFILDEDSAGGAIQDYNFHLGVRDFFLEDTIYGLKNYLQTEAVHSPIFIIFLKYLLFLGEDFGRLIYLHLCLSIVPIFFLCLKKKYKTNTYFLLTLSIFFLLSPYFRSSSIWPGDENLALIFFLCSIYFYNLFFQKKNFDEKILFIFLNTFFLALASYFRPVYSLFSLFYFYQLILKEFNLRFFIFYMLINILLSFPAFYYVFFMKITFFFDSVGSFNFINSFSLTYTVLLFYLIPFLIFLEKNLFSCKFDLNFFIISVILTFIVIFLFDYKTSTGGGILYMFQKIFFSGNIFYGIIFFISFNLVNKFLEIKKIDNLILIIILLFFELDNHFYMETFDPLFLICLFLLFNTKLIKNYIKLIDLKRIVSLYTYLIMFFCTKVLVLYLL
ncbi:hypothetical protein [Candidatus Pelagibacter sp.]|uniref:hypothetical protein n=1 Tax=Candidatus Pelagibacter sp. TaxID=2024849 RepID=UPI003F853677